jgi:hypothetical protein
VCGYNMQLCPAAPKTYSFVKVDSVLASNDVGDGAAALAGRGFGGFGFRLARHYYESC